MPSTDSSDRDLEHGTSFKPDYSSDKQWLDLLCRLASLGLNLTESEEVLNLTPFITPGEFVGGGGCAEVYKAKWNDIPALFQHAVSSLPELAIKIVRVPMAGNQNQRSKGLRVSVIN